MTILISTLLGATALCCYTKSLKIITLSALFLLSSLKKVLRNLLIGNDFVDSPTSLDRGKVAFQNSNRGAIFLLLILFVPIVVGGIKYSQYQFAKRQKSIESLSDPDDASLYKECAREIAFEIARVWNPAKTLGEQKDAAYAIAERIYNSHPCLQKGGIRSAIPGLNSAIFGGGNIELAPSKKQFSYPANAGKDYVKISIASDDANYGKIKVQTDYQVAYAIPAQCNANVILAIPTNSRISSSLNKIGSVFVKFSENFNNTRGVYMGVIPYSGKLSIPSNRSNAWTTKFSAFKANGSQQLLIGACLYATKGLEGTALTEQYIWNNTACPIMFRRGTAITKNEYSDNPYFSGNLLSALDPSGNDQSLKYLQMNLRPCTLSNTSLLGMQCSKNCTEFFANPHAMAEPTDDMDTVKAKCEGLTSFNQTGNNSNFIFAALEWANNMLQNWTADPQKSASTDDELGQLGSKSKTTNGRKNYVILLVNKPDYFENGEITYVGFSDDWKEENLSTEKLNFHQNLGSGTIKSPGSALQLSGASYDSSSGYYRCVNETSCTLIAGSKNLIKLVVAPISGSDTGNLVFTNLKKGGEGCINKDIVYCVTYQQEFFLEPDQIPDSRVIQFKATKVQFIEAEITSRPYRKTKADCSLTRNGNTAIIKTDSKSPLQLLVVPELCWATFGKTDQPRIIAGEDPATFSFSEVYSLEFVLKNAKITNAWLDNQSFYGDTGCDLGGSSSLSLSSSGITNGRYEAMTYSWHFSDAKCASVTVYYNGIQILHTNSAKSLADFKYSVSGGATLIHTYSESRSDIGAAGPLNLTSEHTFKLELGKDGWTASGNYTPIDPGLFVTIYNDDRIYLGSSSGNNVYLKEGQLDSSGKLWWEGKGKPTVVVTPTARKITYTNLAGSKSEKIFYSSQMIVIDPNEYKFEQKNDGYYYVTLQLNRIQNLEIMSAYELKSSYTVSGKNVTINTGMQNKMIMTVKKETSETGSIGGTTISEHTTVNYGYYESSNRSVTIKLNASNVNIIAYLNPLYNFPSSFNNIEKNHDQIFNTPVKKGELVVPQIKVSSSSLYIYCNDLLLASWYNNTVGQKADGVEIEKTSSSMHMLRYKFDLSQPATIKIKTEEYGGMFLSSAGISTGEGLNYSYVMDLENLELAIDGDTITIPAGLKGPTYIEVEPIWGKVTRTDPGGNSQTEIFKECKEYLLTIDPEQYKYEKSGNSYNVRLGVSDLKILDVKSLQEKYIYEFDDPLNPRSGTGNVVLMNAADNETDGTAAAKVVTRKIYENFGPDTTVFLIQYKKKSTDDYSYIGVPPSNIYEADENNLEEKLDEIAEKIKELAGYSEAKIVP